MGLGNPARGDDAAGIAVARRLAGDTSAAVEVAEGDADVGALLDAFEAHRRVILVDAMWSGGRPGTVRRYAAAEGPLPSTLGGPSSHVLGVAEAVELARVLGELPAALVVYAIEGRSWAAGRPLSPEVQDAVDDVAARIRAELRDEAPPGA
jgi:hydrogenase maturation protease